MIANIETEAVMFPCLMPWWQVLPADGLEFSINTVLHSKVLSCVIIASLEG